MGVRTESFSGNFGMQEQLESLFGSLIPGKKPYAYQRLVSEALLAGGNVILSAPTGAGKTWAALLGYLASKQSGTPFVDRIIYALPLRTLATSLHNSTVQTCEKVFPVLKDPDQREGHPGSLVITIQTGAQQDDPVFRGDICFTTIDQLLSGYLNIPLSLPDKLSNINAGALIGALIVVDEIHLLDTQRSLATLVEMVDRLRGYCQFLFMTATLSSGALEILADKLNARVFSPSLAELNRMPSHKDKQRVYKWVNRPLTARDIIEHHQGGRSIVVCNTVGRAQRLFEDLRSLLPANCSAFLLHSRFFSADRKEKEEILDEYFGPGTQKTTNAILVTTQVVEAGIDISADNLHTEVAPINAVIQRAGRCARYPAPRNSGTVWIYELEVSETGKPRLGPYQEAPLHEFVKSTREVLAGDDVNGKALTFPDEQSLVNSVHEPYENAALSNITSLLHHRRCKIDEAIENGNASALGDLIRDIDSVNILLSDKPEEVDFDRRPELISIPRKSVFALSTLFQDNQSRSGGKWLVKIAEEPEGEDERHLHFRWREAQSAEALSFAWLIALSSSAASYTTDLGLKLGEPGSFPEIRYRGRLNTQGYVYRCEAYEEHINKVLGEAEILMKSNQISLSRVSQMIKLSNGLIRKLVRYGCALHDVGKLGRKWQRAARAWQQNFYPKELASAETALAHTTFHPEKGDIARQKTGKYDRGPHAAEGAVAVAEGLFENLLGETESKDLAEDLMRVVISAMARHHGGRTKEFSEFDFEPGALEWVNRSLKMSGFPHALKNLNCPRGPRGINDFKEFLLRPGRDERYLPLYWLVVRILRLADQAATQKASEG